MNDHSHKPASPTDDKDALAIAEQTDVSVNQARDLLRQHGNDITKALAAARKIKAES